MSERDFLAGNSTYRFVVLRTGLIPAANGSAYYELEPPRSRTTTFIPNTSTIKLSCTVLGPKPLPRNASFSPNLQLSASIKFAPFATRQRRGYVRDNTERDLGSHLENALKGVIIPDRWPKSSIDIAVTVLEGEEDCLWTQEQGEETGVAGVGLMNVLAGSITVATAALVDAGIDCLDLLAGGVGAFTRPQGSGTVEILDPCPSEHEDLTSACVVAYLPSRDEVTEVWCKGAVSASSDDTESFETLINAAVRSARGAHSILVDIVKESALAKAGQHATKSVNSSRTEDVEMET